jgi:2-polyprenyl-3-methyl-5-hydroxy-6-metoxy-1,4-benzoquinol methylase
MRYYYPEHIEGYRRVKAEGKVTWGEIHGSVGFESFAARGFLAAVLPTLRFDTPKPTVFNYGCGTGPDACFLAEHGFRVDAVDLIPTAIEIARQQAAARGLDVRYAVQDICELPQEGKQYDMIVDSYCLQCIVFDAERQNVFGAVRARLKPSGYYLISAAIMDEEHQQLLRAEETVTDEATGIVYTRYGVGLIDTLTGVVLNPLNDSPADLPDAVRINGAWHLPHRRHLTRAQLDRELWEAGFKVIYRYPEHAGSVVCVARV